MSKSATFKHFYGWHKKAEVLQNIMQVVEGCKTYLMKVFLNIFDESWRHQSVQTQTGHIVFFLCWHIVRVQLLHFIRSQLNTGEYILLNLKQFLGVFSLQSSFSTNIFQLRVVAFPSSVAKGIIIQLIK